MEFCMIFLNLHNYFSYYFYCWALRQRRWGTVFDDIRDYLGDLQSIDNYKYFIEV